MRTLTKALKRGDSAAGCRANLEQESSKPARPISTELQSRLNLAFRSLRQSLDFGEPSYARYLELQTTWGIEGYRLKVSAQRIARRIAPAEARNPELMKAAEIAWCAAAGANYFTFQRNALRHHSRVMSKRMWQQSVFVRYWKKRFSPDLCDIDGFDQRWAENRTLTLIACLHREGRQSLGQNCFRDLKQTWRAAGGSDADFRWLSKQSPSWLGQVASATESDVGSTPRRISFLAGLQIATRSRLRYAQLTNPQIRLLLLPSSYEYSWADFVKRTGWIQDLVAACLRRESSRYSGPWRKFNPLMLPVDQAADVHAIYSRLGVLSDWLMDVTDSMSQQRLIASATFRSLASQSDRWHRIQQAKSYGWRPGVVFQDPPFKTFVSGALTLEWIGNSDLLLEEGRTMNHCVAGYMPYCEVGTYLVYRISGGLQCRLTVGFHLERGLWSVQQIQGWGNSYERENYQRARKCAQKLARLMNETVGVRLKVVEQA